MKKTVRLKPTSELSVFAVFALTVCLLMFCPPIVTAQATPPTTYGLSLPLPLEPISFPRAPGIDPPIERFVPFMLTIDTFGVLTDSAPDSVVDSQYFSPSDSLLRTYRFIPGMFRGGKQTMHVPVYVHVWPRQSRTRLVFPVDHNMRITDEVLYERALRFNGVDPPVIGAFPSYYCDYLTGDTLGGYSFMLARLSLDSAGSLLAVEKIISTAGTFTDQLLSVINWGVYEPMERGGRKEASAAFLLISLYPEVNYPSKVLRSSFDDSASAQERWRVRLFADTIGPVMAPPIPRRYQDLTYTALDSAAAAYQTVSVRVRIDRLGKIHIGRISSLARRLKKLVPDILERQRFYPAIDYTGRSVEFPGLIYLDFSNSGIVRIQPNWL